MPGFASITNRQRAFRDGMKLAESRSGRDLKRLYETEEARAVQKARQGEAMYKKSDSVPDSLVQFANEIHRVSECCLKSDIDAFHQDTHMLFFVCRRTE
jgi:hypothetical protein